MIIKSILLLGISLFQECPDTMCVRAEQLEVVRVHLARTGGSLDFDRVSGAVFRPQQFSWTSSQTKKANAKVTVAKIQGARDWPEEYDAYRGTVIRAIMVGPGDYTHYRRIDTGVKYSWSCRKWKTGVYWQHGFCRQKDVIAYGKQDLEDQKINKARRDAWRADKNEHEEVYGC